MFDCIPFPIFTHTTGITHFLDASYILLNEILTALNIKQMVGGIFCDLHKAFDCINHAVLLEKMKFYGVSGKFYNLVKSYLDGRYQK